MKKKCQGIAGLLFGHKYEPVFQEDRVMYAAKEMAQIIDKATTHNFYEFYPDSKIKVNPSMAKEITRIYMGSCCSRCGDMINSEIKVS